MARNAGEAFRWIVGILRKQKIPFQVTGGLAARIYGSKRALADIDIAVPDRFIPKILPHVKKHFVSGPRRYRGKSFNVLLLTLKHSGQRIEISGCETEKLFWRKKRKWIGGNTNLSKAVQKKVYNLVVPTVRKRDLIEYKNKIAREVDKLDNSHMKK
ncbi:MAG: hypothetical protein JSV92_01320 [archaeon]|nr:MAG: hypothetical protein JSV92_01320 [archaeon]